MNVLDRPSWSAGGCFISSQGRIVFKPLYTVTSYTDPTVPGGGASALFAPLRGPICAVFPREEIEPVAIAAGWRQRIPVYAIPWGWDATGQRYTQEVQAVNAPALSFYAAAMIDAETRCPTEVAQWISSEGVARALATRHVQSFGLGMIVWRFRCTYPHPELERGDVVVLATDRFLAYDPVANRALAGQMWATGVIVGRYDALGREWAVWIQSLSMLRPIVTGTATSIYNPQNPLSLGVLVQAVFRANKIFCSYMGTPAVQSALVAFSNVSQPAAGTGVLVVGRSSNVASAASYAFTDQVYVTVTPYGTVDGTGPAGAATFLTCQISVDPGIIDPTVGLILRNSKFQDGKYAVQALDSGGGTIVQPGVQTDSARGLVLMKGYVAALGVDTGAVSYSGAFQNTPYVAFRGGIQYEPRVAQWSGGYTALFPQYEDFSALTSLPSGFTIRARLRQKGAATARTSQFPTGSGSDITVVGNTESSGVLANAPSSTDHYTVRYKVHEVAIVANHGVQCQVTVAIDGDKTGSFGWQQFATTNYSFTPVDGVASTFDVTDAVDVVMAGATATGLFRIRVTIANGPLASFFVHGCSQTTDALDGVSYSTATDTFATKTPDAADTITWDAKAIT